MDEEVMKLLTTKQLADKIGVTPRRLLQLAGTREVNPAIVVGRNKLWRETDAAKLKPGKVGRPKNHE